MSPDAFGIPFGTFCSVSCHLQHLLPTRKGELTILETECLSWATWKRLSPVIVSSHCVLSFNESPDLLQVLQNRTQSSYPEFGKPQQVLRIQSRIQPYGLVAHCCWFSSLKETGTKRRKEKGRRYFLLLAPTPRPQGTAPRGLWEKASLSPSAAHRPKLVFSRPRKAVRKEHFARILGVRRDDS